MKTDRERTKCILKDIFISLGYKENIDFFLDKEIISKDNKYYPEVLFDNGEKRFVFEIRPFIMYIIEDEERQSFFKSHGYKFYYLSAYNRFYWEPMIRNELM